MKVSSKFFRCSCVFLLALIVAVSAAVGVSADVDIDFTGFDYIAKDSYGNIFISDSNIRIGVAQYSDESVYILIGNQTTNAYSSLIFLAPYYYDSNGNIQYKLYQLPKNQNQTSLKVYEVNDKELKNTTITYANLKVYKSTTQVYPTIYNIALSNKYTTTNENIADTYIITSNHTLTSSYNGTNQSSLSSSNTIVDDNLDLPAALGNQQLSSNDIINAIDIALKNNENIVSITDSIDIIINYGSDYDQIDSTLIGNLGTAEDQLNSAEDTIQNKSKSLIQRAASGIASAKTASTTLVSALSTTVPQIVSSTTDLIETAPEEVQAAVLSIPLLSFAAWLIGLKK